ncbi:hypothetical protein AXX17_AT3G36950 [Arabidopsis thaliana]|uniref:Reverse transcriptase zinc-binding domain-containing protein n=1 Tax=Arabidopsis thaliana TaxID=3702 RepID=A0A178VML6_ARATH|nr:hypothetical protein AXX17_AT3G36950 [Arabidopsis thaliana]
MSLPKIPEMLLEECKDFVSKSFVKDPKEVWTTEMLLNHSFVAVDLEDNHREDFVVKVKEDEKIGADQKAWVVHQDAQQQFEKDHRLCLVVKGLNHKHQNPGAMKNTLPKAWHLEGKIEGHVNDDGTVNFYFDTEHHLLTVLENGPYTFKGNWRESSGTQRTSPSRQLGPMITAPSQPRILHDTPPHQQVSMNTDLCQLGVTQDIPMIVAERNSKRKISDTDFLDQPTPSKQKTTQATVVEGLVTTRRKAQDPVSTLAKGEADMGMYRSKPRLVLGDFNDVKSNDEKMGGPKRSEASFNLFRRMLSVSGLHDIKTMGGWKRSIGKPKVEFSGSMLASTRKKQLHGFKASRSGPAISHLLFVDDSLVFCKANEEECHSVIDILQQYEQASGHAVNFQKLAVLYSQGIDSQVRKQLTTILGIYKTEGFGRYLGLPEFVGRNKTNAFSFIAHRMEQKLDNWYNKLLSPARKEVLLKSIITVIPTYSMSCFLLPMRLIYQITSAIRRFWWSSTKDKHKIPWIAWTKLNEPKKLGGLAIRDLKDFNIALLTKQGWRILQNPHSLMARIFKTKYFPKQSLLETEATNHSSYAWKSILQGAKLLSHGLKYLVGNGHNIKVSKDNWPSITGVEDAISWLFTKNGNYSVKLGYYIIRQLSPPQHDMYALNLASATNLFTNIWKQNAPPKIKHFWWRAVHNALPTADNLKKRKVTIDDTCQSCGEAPEDVNHLLFQCRVSREVWQHTPLQSPSGIGLIMYTPNGQFVLRGMSAIRPTSSPLEAEVEALKLAMIHLRRLGYDEVLFVEMQQSFINPSTQQSTGYDIHLY